MDRSWIESMKRQAVRLLRARRLPAPARVWIPFVLAALAVGAFSDGPRAPMPVDYTRAATYRWLQKPVHENRLLDGADNLTNWETTGQAEMNLSDRFREGTGSIRLSFWTRTPKDVAPENKRNYGIAGVLRRFPGEDWSKFNRISVWVYPDFPGWKTSIIRVFLRNDGKVKVPGGFYPYYHSAVLKNGAWNQIVWEIPDVPRDRVTGIEIQARRQGHEPEASAWLTLDVDQLELQRVDADHYEGWNVAAGRIAFSHTGYRPDSRKIALASDLKAREFSIVSETGQTVFTGPVNSVKTRNGEFQLLDFTGLREPGKHAIRAGTTVTQPFRVDAAVWDDTIRKAINFFYAERCGQEIPGVHRICHRDWQGVHGDKRIIINGGWHDAGDLSQGLVNTAEAVYAMLETADALYRRDGDSPLYRSVIEEAKWGLDWVLKTSFGDGHRIVWATMGMWTDGILNNNDDVTANATNSPYENFLASAAEGIAARVLKRSDPDLADYCLRKAHEDWQFAVAGVAEKRGRSALIETASAGVLASLELLGATGKPEYGKKAIELAAIITASQQREFVSGVKEPMTGFFYRDPGKDTLLTYLHRSHEQLPIAALAGLCEAFPNHADWMKWYSAVALHSEFFQSAMAKFTEPYRMLPNSLRRSDEYLKVSEAQRGAYQQQVLNGYPAGGDWFVRVYPVQTQGAFRGNYGTMLSQAKAISIASRLRRDRAGELLAEEQLQWVVGRNPFAQSTMYGEGYDYGPQYSAMSGDIVGSLPVGIKSRENYDLPYWPVHNHPNYREVWVHPVTRWFGIVADLLTPISEPAFKLTHRTNSDGTVELRASGGDAYSVRADNISLRETAAGVWSGKVINRNAPWVAVVTAGKDVSSRREVFGWVR